MASCLHPLRSQSPDFHSWEATRFQGTCSRGNLSQPPFQKLNFNMYLAQSKNPISKSLGQGRATEGPGRVGPPAPPGRSHLG